MSGPKMAFLEQSRTIFRNLKTILGPRWRDMIQDQPNKALLVRDTNKKNKFNGFSMFLKAKPKILANLIKAIFAQNIKKNPMVL